METPARAALRQASELDTRGREAEAIPRYREALAGGLAADERARALLGLGSSLRLSGRSGEAVALLDEACREFPVSASLAVFLAFALWEDGRESDAARALIEALLRAGGEEIRAYEEPIRRYAAALGDPAPPPRPPLGRS